MYMKSIFWAKNLVLRGFLILCCVLSVVHQSFHCIIILKLPNLTTGMFN